MKWVSEQHQLVSSFTLFHALFSGLSRLKLFELVDPKMKKKRKIFMYSLTESYKSSNQANYYVSLYAF